MARPGITLDQVSAAADKMVAEGKDPAITTVRDMLGTGSLNTVQRLLVEWRQAQPPKQSQTASLPDYITNPLAAGITKQVAEARAEVEHRLVQAQEEARVLSELGEVLESENATLADQAVVLTSERDRLAGKAEMQEKEILQLQEKVKNLDAATESARLEIATSRLRAESLIENDVARKKEIEKLHEDIARSQESKIAAEQDAAVLRERVASLQQAMAQEVERTLAASISAAEQVKKAEDRANTAAQIAAEQAKKSEDRMEAALSQLRQMQTALDTSRQAESDAKEKLALLRGKMANDLSAKNGEKESGPHDPVAVANPDERTMNEAFGNII